MSELFNEPDPKETREIVSMIQHDGRIILATRVGVYEVKNGKIERIEFMEAV